MVGESSRSVQYRKSWSESMSDVQRAFNLVGKVLEVNKATSTISGRIRYGLQTTRLRVSIIEDTDNRCLLQIQGFGDDIWGGGARKATGQAHRRARSSCR